MQYTESSNNSTLVFKQVQIEQDFDIQRPIFQLIDTYPDIFCFNEHPPFQIYGQQKNVTQIEESVFLGKGSFGKVYCVINYEKYSHEENIVCALKMHKNCNYEDIIQLANEYEIQHQLTKQISDCVVCLVDKVYINQQIVDSYEVSASMELGFINLYEYLINTKEISNEEFDTIYWQILNAIIKMHQLNIAHRDIKPSNIVYIQKKGWVLADFGCCQQYQYVQGFYQIVGTKAYIPQNLRVQIQSFNRQRRVKMNLFQNDIHAFLITMLQIRYRNQTLQQLEQMIKNRQQNDQYLSIYDKSFQEIKLKLSAIIKKALISDMVFLRIVGKLIEESRNQDYQGQRASERLYQHHMNLFYEEKNKFKSKNMTQMFTSAMGSHFKYTQSQYERDIQHSQPLDLITSQTEKWQYDIIYKTLMKRGQIQQMLYLCQKYQGLVAPHCELKLQEIELTICLGKICEAKVILQEIIQDAYNFDDASYLKYHCLKAELFPRDNQELWKKISKYYVYLSNLFQVSDGLFFLYTELRWQEQVNFNENLVRKDTNKKSNIPLIVYLNVKNSIQFQQMNIEISFSESVFRAYCKLLQINVNEELINQLEKRGFDRYAMFMSLYFLGMILSDIPKRYHEAKNLLEKAIYQYEIPNYYYNWRLCRIYAQVLIKLNLLEDAKKVLQQAESKLQEEQNQEKFQLELENWEIYIKQKLYLTNPELFERLPKLLLKIKSSHQKLIVSILQRIQNELLISSNLDRIILLELMEKLFEEEENTDLLRNVIRFKFQILLTQENMELIIEKFNSILINLNRKGLLDSFQKNIWRFFDQINNEQRRSITKFQRVDVINYHQKLIQQEIIDTDLFPNEDRFQYEIGKSLSEYLEIILYFKLNDKVAEFKQLNYSQNYVFRL